MLALMIKRRSSTRSGLFLIELIVSILFFSIASAVCIQLFVKAHLISSNSKNLSMALNQVQSVAESFKASDGSAKSLKSILDAQNGENPNELVLLFDKDWNKTNSNGAYELCISLDNKSPVTAKVWVTKTADKSNHIYEIEAKKYLNAQ